MILVGVVTAMVGRFFVRHAVVENDLDTASRWL